MRGKTKNMLKKPTLRQAPEKEWSRIFRAEKGLPKKVPTTYAKKGEWENPQGCGQELPASKSGEISKEGKKYAGMEIVSKKGEGRGLGEKKKRAILVGGLKKGGGRAGH